MKNERKTGQCGWTDIEVKTISSATSTSLDSVMSKIRRKSAPSVKAAESAIFSEDILGTSWCGDAQPSFDICEF